MNPAEISIRNKTVTLVFTALMVIGGILSYVNISRLEDPEFTIKDALVVTSYPGASAAEVADEVSDVIERALQQMGQLDRVTSRSERGRSTVTATIKAEYDKTTLPQVWDELRRRIGDAQRHLPPGATPSLVIDDFGDVFGIFYAITGPDYTQAELYEIAKMLRQNLVLVDDVNKVEIFADQQEVIYVEMARNRMAQLGIQPREIAAALGEQNLVRFSGIADSGTMRMTIDPTGSSQSVESLGEIIIRQGRSGPGEDSPLIFLRDIATITRDYIDPPHTLLRYDGQPAVGLTISTVSGGNVVWMGAAVERRLEELRSQIPLGVELHQVSFQADNVTEAINNFVLSLAQAVGIVFVILLIFMGMRSGMIIGGVLFITICATMIVMESVGVSLERISLGALIIALGMLVDNAIVITEGMLVAIQRGVDRMKAAKEIVKQTAMPLLGSTAIAILAFGAIGLSQDSTGEYCRSLFIVLLVALGISWITAVTITPLLCYMFIKGKPEGTAGASQEPEKDPYGGALFVGYKSFLNFCLRRRRLTIVSLVMLLGLSGFAFRFVEQSFFPDSTRRQFMIDVWSPVGIRLDQSVENLAAIEEFVLSLDGVTHVATVAGRGAPRFLLTYAPEQADTGYALLMVDVDDHLRINELIARVQEEVTAAFPDNQIITRRFMLGPGAGGRIQARFSGPNHDDLRSVAVEAMNILRRDGGAQGVRLDCREQVHVLRPQFMETEARRASVTRTDLAHALESTFSGRRMGIFREGDEIIPIVLRSPYRERYNPDMIRDVQVFSSATATFVPIRQVVSDFTVEVEDPIIMRRNRQSTITMHADPITGLPSALFERVREQIEAIPLPPGVVLEWGGEYEDSGNAQAAVASSLPFFLLMMVLIVLTLFNCIKTTLIIWITVPFALIGIVAGLLLAGQPFGFMALLGALSLSGMLIKNGIVLVDEIRLQINTGKAPWAAVVDASVSRLRPVSMAALTTVLGLIPLLVDAFFAAMAVTVMAGLLFATVLTLIMVPVLYVAFFKIRPDSTPTKAEPVAV
ncbi:MAG TPA: efflux RND transporter permease subunit [Kiritimatiellia bacterium]|nr:efflux RND transporter permease subunit [Kiritimatiellia bacterium]HMP34127.1 efflux RND transporter permease subunit [Kiritimatiellia bacterium]